MPLPLEAAVRGQRYAAVMKPVSSDATFDVALTVCDRWRDLGEEAFQIPWESLAGDSGVPRNDSLLNSCLVVVPRQQCAEVVVAASIEWGAILPLLSLLERTGWKLSVVAPLSTMGQVHEALQNLHAGVQGWWASDDQTFRFSPLEHA